MPKTSIFTRYMKIVVLLYCCSSCTLVGNIFTRTSEDAEMRSNAIHVISKRGFFQMSFPASWGAIYKDINSACELYMTDGTSFCYVEALSKEENIEQILHSIKKGDIVTDSKKAKKQAASSEAVWRKTVWTDQLTIKQQGYNELYQTFLTTHIAAADEEAKQLNTVVWVIEGKNNYYIINVGKLVSAEVPIDEVDRVQHYLLSSFTMLKDAKVDHFTDCVLSNRLQQYNPSAHQQ